MSVRYLDCSHEVSDIRRTPEHRRAWLAHDISLSDWVISIDQPMSNEIVELARYIVDNPVQNLQRRASDLSLPHSARAMARMKSILDDGVGFAVLDKLPMDEYSIDTLVEIYWLLGQFIGRPVAQKWNGQMIYDVRDTGQAYEYGVRGSYTSVELVFHTDNAFAKMVPDYVGLLCRNPAASGGVSRFCSLYTVHDRMLALYPRCLERLYQPMYFDRQKEHKEGAEKVCYAPYFSWRGDRLFARANSSLVRKGYDVAEVEMDAQLAESLDAIDEVCASEEIWFEAPLQRGHVQYLNNHEVGHYRSEFSDHEEADKKRHLYRLWHRETGSTCYDGGYPPSARVD